MENKLEKLEEKLLDEKTLEELSQGIREQIEEEYKNIDEIPNF